MADAPITIHEVARPANLPPSAHKLLGQDAFSTPAWYQATLQAGLAPGAQPAFQFAEAAGRALAVLPMLRDAGRLSALSTPYTCLWCPLLAPGLSTIQLENLGRAFARHWRRNGVVRLDAMPAPGPAAGAFLAGLRRGGLHLLAFDNFGNWHEDVAGQGWDTYLAARPRRLRTAIVRQTRRLIQQPGFRFTLTRSEAGLDPEIAAYETVYAASWKQPEPHPGFNQALMRACAADGTLRLGVLRLGNQPIAAQLWLVHASWAGVLKLAYDEACKTLAPGNVLTGLMIRHLLDTDHIGEIDFGRGDDDYKQHWARLRRQRVGVLVANPFRFAGALEIGRHLGGKVRKGLLF